MIMNRQSAIKHAHSQGVTLRKIGDTLSPSLPPLVGPVFRPTVVINGHDQWSRVWASPRKSIKEWITSALVAGDYATAADLSARLHARYVNLPADVVIFPTA